MFRLCFTLVTLQFARIIFHTKRRENCCYIGFATEIENMLGSGLFIFNSFSSVLFASSEIPLHPSKLLKEAISMLLVWPVRSMHASASELSEETFLLLSHHLVNCPVDKFSTLMSYLPTLFALSQRNLPLCLLHCFSHVQWLNYPPYELLERVRRTAKLVKCLENKSYEEQLRTGVV